ncbi:MAG: hypothetical protein U0905_05965 [Pirellulales bacterium]
MANQQRKRISQHLPMVCVVVGALGLCGCKQWPQTLPQQAQYVQQDQERLLSELRAHKKRADELQARNEQLTNRLDESERMVARLQNSKPSSRLSSADPSLGRNSVPSYAPSSIDPSLAGKDPKSLGASTGSGSGAGQAPRWRSSRRSTATP